MRTREFGLFILCFSLIFLLGCQLPFSVSYQVKNYLSEAEAVFNQSQSELDSVGNELETENLTQEKIKNNVEILSATIDREQANFSKIKDLNPPQPAEQLEADLNSYYQKSYQH